MHVGVHCGKGKISGLQGVVQLCRGIEFRHVVQDAFQGREIVSFEAETDGIPVLSLSETAGFFGLHELKICSFRARAISSKYKSSIS